MLMLVLCYKALQIQQMSARSEFVYDNYRQSRAKSSGFDRSLPKDLAWTLILSLSV